MRIDEVKILYKRFKMPYFGQSLMSQVALIKEFERVCQIMRENRGALSMKIIGPNLAVPPDGDLPQVQICDSVPSE